MTHVFSSLRSVSYRTWFFGALISNAGVWMQATTQNWVVLTELSANSAIAMGFTIGLQLGPQLLLMPWSGLVADRFDRRRVMMVTQSLMFALCVILGLLHLSGTTRLWHFMVFALLLGSINAFDAPARQALIADLVDRDDLPNAVSLNSASWNTSRLIGPALAGVLIMVIGSGWVFIINGSAFLAMIVALAFIHPEKTSPAQTRLGFWKDAAAGLHFVKGRSDLRAVFLAAFFMGGFGMNSPVFTSTMSVMFGRGSSGYGILSSIFAVGAITGALMAARRKTPSIRVICIAAGLYGILSTIAAMMPTFETYALLTIFTGMSIVSTTITSNSYVQVRTEDRIRGRVMALYMATTMGGAPVGAFVAGWAAETFGARWSVAVGAAAGFIACIITLVWLYSRRGEQEAEPLAP